MERWECKLQSQEGWTVQGSEVASRWLFDKGWVEGQLHSVYSKGRPHCSKGKGGVDDDLRKCYITGDKKGIGLNLIATNAALKRVEMGS